jgi:hypothetical protein
MTHAAGILIVVDGHKFLLAYTPKIAAWSGFGGKIEGDETPWECAVRETFEELFGCSVPAGAAGTLHHSGPLQDEPVGTHAPYLTYVVRFEDILALGPLESPYYSTFPRSAEEICNMRKVVEGQGGQELTNIKVMEFDHIVSAEIAPEIAPEMLEDITIYLKKCHPVEFPIAPNH